MPIVSSVIVSQVTQGDGSLSVHERHTDHHGKTHDITYFAPAAFDTVAALAARAANIGAEIDSRDAVEVEASNFVLPISKLQFRNLLTFQERMAIDAFNMSFEQNGALTTEQKAMIRTNLEDYRVAENVVLTNPATIAGVNLYESLGLIAPGRATQIIFGG